MSYLENGYFHTENRKEILRIAIKDIYYFEKIKGTHSICVVFANGLSTFRSDLQDVLEQLRNNGDGKTSSFLQCHRAYIANMANVKKLEKYQNGYILHFDNGQKCYCSVFYKKAVANWKP